MKLALYTKAVVAIALTLTMIDCKSSNTSQTTTNAPTSGPGAKNTPAATAALERPTSIQNTRPEEYHDVDPAKARFSIALEMNSLGQND